MKNRSNLPNLSLDGLKRRSGTNCNRGNSTAAQHCQMEVLEIEW